MNPTHQRQQVDTACGCGSGCAASPAVGGPMASKATAVEPHRFRIANMDCASEESEIRRALDGVAGIRGLQFNLGDRELAIAAEDHTLRLALDAIRKAGFKPEPLGVEDKSDGATAAAPTGFWASWGKLIAALGLAVAAEGLAFAFPDSWPGKALGMALAAVAIVLAGFSVYGKGLAALRQGRLNINALMTVAVTGAFLIGQWPEAAMVMALYAIAEAIEARAVDRARNAIKSLLALAPEQAEVRQGDGSWTRVGVKAVVVDATVRIRPGERVPLDGVVTLGQSAIDQSPVTGESLPIDKAPGDEVYAGTINQSAALEFRVTAPASDSTLARIIHAVEQAQSSRAPTQRFVDRFARIYTPTVFVLAVLLALLPPLLAGHGWLDWLYKALVMLVIACPCALVISTPVTIVSGLAAAARQGILIKGGSYLETGRQLTVLAFDKTGTLTHGKPALTEQIVLSDAASSRRLAVSLAARSDHPVSQAIVRGLPDSPLAVDDFRALPGLGVCGQIGGTRYHLGNRAWMMSMGLDISACEEDLRTLEAQGKTVVFLASSQQLLALFAVADTVRANSQQAIAALHALGIKTVMLSGDNQPTADTIAHALGITTAQGNLLPEDKLRAIERWIADAAPGRVGMVGDGINDAPALAAAHIGFAMGAMGTDTAIETADVALMNDDPGKIAVFVRLSHRCFAILRQNIALALGIKLLFMGFALAGQATMWMAVFADMGASLLVVGNGLRLLRQ